MIAEGNQAFARLRFSGMHRAEFFGYQPTGKRVEWAGAAVFTFAGEKISALWVLGDIHGLLQQLANNARPYPAVMSGHHKACVPTTAGAGDICQLAPARDVDAEGVCQGKAAGQVESCLKSRARYPPRT